jgi:hypothetical protein
MNQLQALVTGVVAGSLTNVHDLIVIDVEIQTDDEGNYLPELYVIGRNSGMKLRISVDVVEEGEQ